MKDKIKIDVGVGDVVDPLIQELSLESYRGKPIFESAISLQVYPAEFIFSEKLETALSKGAANSRMKDYHDLILLIRKEGMINLDKLKDSITRTLSNRRTTFRPIQFDETALKDIQRLWAAHLHDLGDNAKSFDLPKDIAAVIEEINKYVLVIDETSKVEKTSRSDHSRYERKTID